jgi:adenosylmethionine-8-amino-7-oxononanoate aminotransferase
MSVGARSPFTASYEPLLFDVQRVPFPHAGAEAASIAALELFCADPQTAAFILEPLVLGAGGMLMYGADTLTKLRDVCTRHGVIFIADEVMTGWGRTGTLSACDQANIAPDIACYSKGLTGGLLPLAATVCREEIYATFFSQDRSRTFFHSSSFTGNPLACAAALANIEVWESEPVRERISALSKTQARMLDPFRADPRLENVRRCGTITAMDVKVDAAGYLSTLGPRLHRSFLESNVLLRPLGNIIYVMPPYCVSEDELNAVYSSIDSAIDMEAASSN